MTSGLLAKLTLLAADGAGSGFSFDELAQRFRAGKGGMYPIALCVVIALAIIVERIIVLFFSASINKEAFLRGLKKHIYAGDLDKAINYVAGQKTTPAHQRDQGRPDERAQGRRRGPGGPGRGDPARDPKLEARTGYLAMIGNAAMLSGLLGTVNGLIGCFEAVAHVNPADKATILSQRYFRSHELHGLRLAHRHPGADALLACSRAAPSTDQRHQRDLGAVLNLIVEQQGQVQERQRLRRRGDED